MSKAKILFYSSIAFILVFGAFQLFKQSNYQIAYEIQPHLRCLPIEITLLKKSPLLNSDVERGMLVIFDTIDYPDYYFESIKILKLVVGLPGDKVEMSNGRILVNDDLIGTYSNKDDFHRFTPIMDGQSITLSDGQYWLSGSSSISVDSRYIGPVTIQHMIGKGYAII